LSELEVLVELQELDTRLAQLSHRFATLPEHKKISEVRGEEEKLEEQLDEIMIELKVLRQSQIDREAEVQGLEDKIAKSLFRRVVLLAFLLHLGPPIFFCVPVASRNDEKAVRAGCLAPEVPLTPQARSMLPP
jgi:hypothetical protein